jgi:hypothetical protein
MDIEHDLSLSWFRRKGESHEQDGERLSRAATPPRRQHPAILPWPSISFDGAGPRPAVSAASLPDCDAEDFASVVSAREFPAREFQRRIPRRSISVLYRVSSMRRR